MSSREVALLCARIAYRMKGEQVTVLNVRNLFPLADYFVIVTSNSRVHSQALCAEIEEELKNRKIQQLGIEGQEEGRWILMDYCDVIVHIFLEEVREYYDLEMLWGDAKKVKWKR
ncbi:MAG: ribosome silencing factor [Planctomycetota bacterium]|nr:ribosome silencing factor [Planctomycetota bacterium]